MKHVRRIAVLLVVLCIMAMLPASADSVGDGKGQIVDGIYRYNETVTVNALARYNTQYVDDPQGVWIYKWALDKMNINFVIEGVPNESIKERTTLLFASNDLPDCLLNWGSAGLNNLQALTLYGDEEHQLRALNEFIVPEIMPNYSRIYEELPDIRNFTETIHGNIYGFSMVLQNPEYTTNLSSQMIWYKTAWLDAVGYSTPPATADELLDALRKIKAQDPGGVGADNLVPLGGNDSANPMPYLFNCFGFVDTNPLSLISLRNVQPDSAELVATPTHEAYYAFLQYMATLYAEGLIDRDFYTLDAAQVNAKASAGYFAMFPGWNMYSVLDTWNEWEVIPPVTTAYNDRQIFGQAKQFELTYWMFLSAGCPDDTAEALMRLMDVGFGADTKHLFYHGPRKGVDDGYGMLEGWEYAANGIDYIYHDMVSKYDGVKSAYTNNVSFTGPSGNMLDRRTDGSEVALYDPATTTGYTNLEIVNNCSKYLVESSAYVVNIKHDSATSIKLNDISTVLNDYLKSEVAKFITGVRPLTPEEFELFGNDLRSMGLDEYFEIQNEAFTKQN